MKCILLCAGYSTRLYPLTLDQPKPLLPIAGKPMVEHILEKIEKVGNIDEVLIVSNNKFFDNFRNWKRKFSFSKPIKILNDGSNSNDDRLGAIGDINYALKQENIDEEVFVVAGDNLFKFDLRELFSLFREKKSSVIALYDIKDRSLAAGKYGVVELSDDCKILDIEEKPDEPRSTIVSTACYIFSEEVVRELKNKLSEENIDNIGDFVKHVAKDYALYGKIFDEDWIDIGSPTELKKANMGWNL